MDILCSKTFLRKVCPSIFDFSQRETATEFVVKFCWENNKYIDRSKGFQVLLNKFWVVYAVGNNIRLFIITFMNFSVKQ